MFLLLMALCAATIYFSHQALSDSPARWVVTGTLVAFFLATCYTMIQYQNTLHTVGG